MHKSDKKRNFENNCNNLFPAIPGERSNYTHSVKCDDPCKYGIQSLELKLAFI